jgi:hypothetical protein
MDKSTKLYLMYGGAVVVASVVFSFFYTKNRLKSKANEVVSDSEETPTSIPTKPNPFTQYVNNPLPTSIDYKFLENTDLFGQVTKRNLT